MEVGNNPNDREIYDKIYKMGPDEVMLNRFNGSVIISFHRYNGCGRIYRQVCNYLSGKFLKKRVIVFQSPRPDKTCNKTYVREPGQRHFKKVSMTASAELLGIVRAPAVMTERIGV